MFNTLGNFVEISIDSIKEKKKQKWNHTYQHNSMQCKAMRCNETWFQVQFGVNKYE